MTPTEWLLGNDTGTSSKAICAVLTGSTTPNGYDNDVPNDPDDFGRCYRLLGLFPEWLARLDEVATALPNWTPIIENWASLSALYVDCSEPDGRYTLASYKRNSAASKELFDRLQKLRCEGMRLTGWIEIAPGSWEKSIKPSPRT